MELLHVCLFPRFNALHIPGLMINHTDWTHHTSEDTPDKVDPAQLQRSEMIALSSFLYLSDLTAEEAVELAWYAGSNRSGGLAEAGHRAHRRIQQATTVELGREWAEVENMLRHTLCVGWRSSTSWMENARPRRSATP